MVETYDLANSVESLKNLRESFNTNNIRGSFNIIEEATKSIEEQSTEYIQQGIANLEKLKQKVSSQKLKLDLLTKELSDLDHEANMMINQDNLIELVNELDSIEKENLQLKNKNDKRVNELAETYKSNEIDDKGIINQIDQAEDEEAQKILEDPVSRANILKLKLFRSLGVIVDTNSKQVFIEHSDKLDVLSLNEGYSDYFKTKYIWERIKLNKSTP